MKPPRRKLRRPDVRRAAPVLPTSFTLGNVFFGIFAFVSASRGEFGRAVLYIVFGGLCDALDGRVARATSSGSEFGEQLDSLVDAITFGLAPAMIVYFSALNREGWSWVLAFFFTACAVARLARFNVTQAGASKAYFIGMPSPAAGGTLATYYWFSQTSLYQNSTIATWPWHELVWYLIVGLGILMVSPVPYPAWPRIGVRTWSARIGLVVVLSIVIGLLFYPKEFLFSFGVGYALYGLVRVAILGLWERRQVGDPVQYEQYANEFVDELDDEGFATDDSDEELNLEPAPPRVETPRRSRPTPRAGNTIAAPAVAAASMGDRGGIDGIDGIDGAESAGRPKRKRRRRPRGDRPPGPDHSPSTDGTE